MHYDFISIRGTNGAGKSTLVRQLMENCQNVTKHFVEGRKLPAYYTMSYIRKNNGKTFEHQLAVLGHYETTSGGCDNLSTTDQYYELAHKALDEHKVDTVIAEGMICSKEFSRIQKMKHPVMLHLNLPIEECFRGVQERRIKAQKSVGRNEEKLMQTLIMNDKGVQSSCRRLSDTRKVDYRAIFKREDAWPALVELIEFDKQF